ncbi:histidine phosphatase family protein [uncultured Faecalibaculum sp.]|uniref:histidine phosphatase family protein n=1 Tax=uncultured Faecalibaculum sp. TaxID=1729681 RepID=UPI00260CB17C|nr:histidine phosphatase family protein [uncultured Faecalibaculum sp.]
MENTAEEKRPDSQHKRLILIRHGQTEFNTQNRLQGWSDSPLTEEGRKQMEISGAILKQAGLQPDVIWCSDLGRAVESAGILLPHASRMAMPALREYSFGEFDGKPAAQAPGWDELPAHGAEDLTAARDRLAKGIGYILSQTPEGQSAVAVTHGIAASLILTLAECDRQPEWFSNGCLLVFDWDEETLRLQEILNNEQGKE